MNDITKYIILNHIHWIESGMTKKDIYKVRDEIQGNKIFSRVNVLQIQKKLEYKLLYKELIVTSDYEKIIFLLANLSIRKIDLSFLKYCTNLEEVNISCYDETSLDILINNTKLKKITANCNKINNIEALYTHNDLEYLDIENNPCCSLKPITHLKNIKNITVDIIEDEKDAINILKNNSDCKLNYIIEGGETDFDKLIFPFFIVIITKDINQITIIIEAMKDTKKYTESLYFPEDLTKDEAFMKKYYDKAKKEIISRLELITRKPISLIPEKLLCYQEFYGIEYTHIN